MKELGIIKQALDVANQKGCYNLENSYTIFHAYKVVETRLNQKAEPTTSVEKPKYKESTTLPKKPNKGKPTKS
jgi:hypothetical protein